MGGMKGKEIGSIMEIGYTAVSQERKRLREKVEKDKGIRRLMERIEQRL